MSRRAPGGRRTLYIYGAAAVVVGGVVLWTKHRAAVAGTTPDQPADTSGYDQSYTDSGLYGDASSSPITSGGTYGTYPGIYPGTYGPVQGRPTNNYEWAQQTLSLLQQEGFDTATASVAIGLYLAGRGLTQHQMDIVQAGLAVGGQPPNPPARAPHLIPAPGQKTQLHAGPQLTIRSQSRTSAVLHWTSIPGATHYRLRHANGIVVADVPGNTHTVNRPKVTTAYYVVTAYQGNKQVSKDSNHLAVTATH
jgi:hypothetical protein